MAGMYKGKYQREDRIKSRDKIALCNCKLPIHCNYAGYHETLQVNGVCSFCEHYVFWGTEEDMTKDLKSVKNNIIRIQDNDEYALEQSEKVYEKYPLEYKEQVRKKYEDSSYKVDEVCKMFNLPRSTVMAWKKKYGWKARRR